MEKSPNHISIQGLTETEVIESRQKYGTNILTPPQREPWWQLFLEKFDDPIIRILIIAAIISLFVGILEGKYLEGVGIIIAIVLATFVGFFNEYKASQEFDLLRKTNDEEGIEVIRNGHYTTVAKKELVVGDIVIIEIGQEIPADGKAIEAVSLQVNEAKLTGETKPVKKYPLEATPPTQNTDTAYPVEQLLRGTVIVEGHGMMQITAVGDNTEIGKAAISIQEDNEIETPLNIQLGKLGQLIGFLGFSIAVLIDIALVLRGIITNELNLAFSQWYFILSLILSLTVALIPVWLPIIADGLQLSKWKDLIPESLVENNSNLLKKSLLGLLIFGISVGIGIGNDWLSTTPTEWITTEIATKFLTYFMIAVAIIVVAVPEGLPLSVTLSLAYSMRKMAQQNNLVRRMHACETIGAITVICSDKTGTLTLNEMLVSDVHFPAFDSQELSKKPVTDIEKLIIESMSVNSTANLDSEPGKSSLPLGNPTEASLLLWLEKNNIDYLEARENFKITDQITFTTERKYMATLGLSSTMNNPILYVKGAPEILLAQCTQILTKNGVELLTDNTRKDLSQKLQGDEINTKRTLAFAYTQKLDNYQLEMELNQQELDLVWLGFVGICDPIRPEVPQAIEICRQAGVAIKMVTGDSRITAENIARELGILTKQDGQDRILTGPEFRELDEEAAKEAVIRLKVLSRARPTDKQRLVELLQSQGEVVAVTGDGTNDAPALKQAQVGLAMGKIGTDVAKEASDIIILDDSFSSIEKAVLWGRSLYQNIQKFILFQLTINVAACGIALLGPFIGVNLPLTVTQLLWVNLIMDTFAALALATEPPREEVMKLPPRDAEDFIISKPMATSIFTVGPIFLVFLVGFLLYIQEDQLVTPYELTLFFSTFVMLQFWNIFNAKCFGLKNSIFTNLFDNIWFVIIAGLIFVGQIFMVQFGGDIFRTVPLSTNDWLIIVGGTSIVLWIGEGWRFISRLKSSQFSE